MNLIYSQWMEYLQKENYINSSEGILELKEQDYIDFHEIHASGHASREDILRLVQSINAEKVIPIHTGDSKAVKKYLNDNNINTVELWKEKLPNIKQRVDYHLSEKNSLEREFQQLVACDNTFSKVSNGTDYFIVDTEMADSENESRFDMLAIKWLSTSAARKVDKTCRLAIIEMKYGTEAFGNLESHFNHIDQYSEIESLKESILVQFKQLRELGLIQFSPEGNKNEVTILEGDVEFIVLLANYDPNSTIINEHLSFMKKILLSNLLPLALWVMAYMMRECSL